MSKRKVILIGQFPPPIHGLSKALETLYQTKLNTTFVFDKINLTKNSRFLINIFKLLFSNADLYYLTISQSKVGNIRDLFLLLIVKAKKKKYVVHLHGGYYRKMVEEDLNWFQRRINYKFMNGATAAIVLGDSLKYHFQGMIPEKRIHVVPNCVDDAYLMGDRNFENKVKQVEGEKTKHILYLSNMISTKGYLEVLKLAKYDTGGHFYYDFAGKFYSKSDEANFKNYIIKNHMQDRVVYHGIVMGNDKMELLKAGYIFMLPTWYPKEGQPISILEAMGNGLAIVSTKHAGIPDIVENGVNGILLSRSYSFDELLVRMLSLNYRKIAVANREKVLSEYTEQNYITQLLKIFSESMK